MKSDSSLKQDVMEELAWDPTVDENQIGVEVQHGIVTLAGHVDSYAEKLAAERAVLRVRGVKGLAVEIDVNPPGAHRQHDADIASAANTALCWNSTVPRESVGVMVEDGVITLSGEVVHAFQREAAEHAVSNLLGVKQIRNNITIKPAIVSKEVKSQIEAALQRLAHIDAQAITVSVKDDHITLEGPVSSWAERKAVLNAAWAAPGVVRVYDKMVVTP
jgi:osmotically-inducible protein OsmY